MKGFVNSSVHVQFHLTSVLFCKYLFAACCPIWQNVHGDIKILLGIIQNALFIQFIFSKTYLISCNYSYGVQKIVVGFCRSYPPPPHPPPPPPQPPPPQLKKIMT